MDNGSAAIAAVAGQALHSRSWPHCGQSANAPEATGMTGFDGSADIVSGRCPGSAASVGPMTAPQGAELTHPTLSRRRNLEIGRSEADARNHSGRGCLYHRA